ncbi:MAG TPA: 4-(cytidine 5'-diphospho)-2-C-methyl-D-erythritol kinase [Pyrinomonadaceae bacterium]|nr:4-(cytidine 5'-diphospho)-2-C-methyl-D-erythritol kinase [Pyrinomonadaceae bacterium]
MQSGGWRFQSKRGQPPVVSVAAFTLPSFAKINWRLRVLGRRGDGYHELRTIFQTVTLRDHLTFAPRDDDRLHLTSDSPEIPLDESNLVLRAADALRDARGLRRGASIHLEKVIPVEAGLGGGSSNAAVTLLGLARLWGLETGLEELSSIGTKLGADVPFFFTGGTALGTGLGTEITPLGDVVAEHLLIVKPEAKVSTAEAYKALNSPALTKAGGDANLSISRADEQFTDSHPIALHNDFEPVVFPLKPEIERARDALLNAGARSALLAGSGSSVFGVFDKRETRERAHLALKGDGRWHIFPCATLARGQYLAALGAAAAPLLRESPPRPRG